MRLLLRFKSSSDSSSSSSDSEDQSDAKDVGEEDGKAVENEVSEGAGNEAAVVEHVNIPDVV